MLAQPLHQHDRPPQLQLVPAPHKFPSAFALWHLLSLDAPTVATLWTIFLSRCAGLKLPWVEPAAMFVAVWMLYAADRLLDARPLLNGTLPADLEDRHHFHQRHRVRFLTLIILASLLLVYLLHRIDARALHLYALLATLLGAWLLLVHARPSPTYRLPKELSVGVFFSAAVFVPTVARAPQLQRELIPTAILFAAVCTLNCLCIYAWEHPIPRTRAHPTTRWATSHLTQIALIIILAASLTAVFAHPPYPRLPAIACALSTALLLFINSLRSRLSTVHFRAAADLTLLTPLLFALSSLF